eukprot:TRINITY_DN1198_c4_g1_i1.p1 TRINITY_DN1198_c4_g1~~TRINITY_DN1198_c4_g1_i1.p1  ORF type:complete len:1029 (+),score=344.93 TRINITY_DN1198_c4_g1_i1:40-3126(+)
MAKKRKSSGFGQAAAGFVLGRSAAKEKNETEKANPFERLWNRRKFEVVGKKVKGEQKRVGKARSDAVERRKASLLQEYKQRNTGNTFLDRRFGENDPTLEEEEKASGRFQRERQAQLSQLRSSKFNLKDEEEEEEDADEDGALGAEDILTHGGTALAAERADYSEEAERREEAEDDGLDAEMVRDFHFGGGFEPRFRRDGGEEGGAPGDDEAPKTKKEAMEELIAKSKFFKAQKQKEKEADEELREKLDEDFRQLTGSDALISLLRPAGRGKRQAVLAAKGAPAAQGDKKRPPGDGASQAGPQAPEQDEDYEKLAREMAFEMRARAGERMKTAEEAAEAEKERLTELEEKRKRRMSGEVSEDENEEDEEEDPSSSRRSRKTARVEPSGDDLGDNLEIDEEYMDGKGWVYDVLARKGGEEDEEEEGSSDEDEDEDEGDNEENDNDEDEGEEEDEKLRERGGEGSEGEDDEESEDEGQSFGLDGADWEQSDEEEGKAAATEPLHDKSGDLSIREEHKEEPRKQKKPFGRQEEPHLVGKKRKEDRTLRSDRGLIGAGQEGGLGELAYVIDAPQSLGEFRCIVDGRDTAELQEAIRRIRACNAISLAAENRKKMQVFYSVLLQYFAALAGQSPLPLSRIDALIPPLLELSATTPLFAAVCARARISRMQEQLTSKLREAGGDGPALSCWPSIRTLLLMRLWTLIFPPSDFRHPVMTPALLLCAEYLARCPVRSLRDAAVGTFLSAQVTAMAVQGGRFCPEVLGFVHALLRTALPSAVDRGKDQTAGGPVPLYLAEQVGKQPWLCCQSSLAAEGADAESATPDVEVEVEPLDFCRLLGSSDSDPLFSSNELRLGLLMALLRIAQSVATTARKLPSFPELFAPLESTLEALGACTLPGGVERAREELAGAVRRDAREILQTRLPLQMRAKRPEPIKMFNPKFEENFVLGRDYDPDRERSERKKLQRQIKREARGAARELRKDNWFLAEEKAQEQRQAEAERADKYKRAMGFLQEQEAAYKSGQLGGNKKRGKRR